MSNCFPMLSETYAAALRAESDRARDLEETDTICVPPVTFPGETREEPAPDEDMETARTRPLSLDSLHL